MGLVRRLDNSTLPWVDVSVPASGAFFTDVGTLENTPDEVIVIGNNNKVYKSTNAGVTWIASSGNITSLPGSTIWTEMSIVGEDFVAICNRDGKVAISTDGGSSFTLTSSDPGGGGLAIQSIHFITNQIGVVATYDGSGVQVWKTVNAGTSWTGLNASAYIGGIGVTTGANGIFMSPNQTYITLGTKQGVWNSSNSGTSFTLVLNAEVNTPEGGLRLYAYNENHIWFGAKDNELWKSTNNNGSIFFVVQTYNVALGDFTAFHFWNPAEGYLNGGATNSQINYTSDSGFALAMSETFIQVNAIYTGFAEDCYTLTSCDEDAYPSIENVRPDIGVDLASVVGQVINSSVSSTNDPPFTFNGCYTVSRQLDKPCDLTPGVYYLVTAYTAIGDCGDFEITSECPISLPLTVIGNTEMFQISVQNNSADDQDFNLSLGSCPTSGLSIVTASPITIPAGATAVIDLEYTPTAVEEGTCEILVAGPCTTQSCQICFRSINIPACPHFNICITGPTCAPDCIKPGEVISFNLGGTITPSAYPTIVTFNVVNQATHQSVFTVEYPVTSDADLDAILINLVAGEPGKYCAEVCLPGCNTKRVLCFDVCEPFDIYKDACNKWHVHRPGKCMIEQFIVSIYEFGDKANPIVNDEVWDISQDNTFEFEFKNDGIYIFEMKDPDTGEVVYSFSAFETCGIQKCFKILMDKIMCSCSDPCCKRCDGSAKEHKEFARMTLNQLMPLYFTYLGMARRDQLHIVGMKLISDEQGDFLHTASETLEKIRDIIMDCGCLCPEQKNTASNRGDCSTC